VDRARFDQLLLDHLPAALRLATRLTGDVSSAEDVLHDAIARASAAWRSLRGPEAARGWLTQIVVNAFRDHLRQSRRLLANEPLPEDDEFGDRSQLGPPIAAAGREFAEIVAVAVSTLPPRQREVLVLIAFELLAPADAAAALGITEQNLRTTLHLARAALRRRLEPYLSEAGRAPRA
jgi:RNA polymerase sigma-70 factor (ECF subfamily)